MIAFVRVAGIKPGKDMAAMGFAKEMVGYLKSKYQIDTELLRPVGGNPQRIAWSSRYADLAALDAFRGKLLADGKYWEMVNGAADCFVTGSIHDAMWQTL
jgi:hypothetical protein